MNKRGVPTGLLSIFMLCVFSLFAFPQTSTAALNCPETITSYWKLDTERNNPYINEIDTEYNGEHIGVAPELIEGAIEGAQEFDGSATGIDIPASGTSQAPFDWEATDSFTIELWVKRAAGIADNEVALGRDDAGTDLHWWVGLNASGVAAFHLVDANKKSPLSVLLGSTDLADGQWHHIVAVRDADLGKNLLYVDGELENSVDYTYVSGNGGFKSSTASLNIGWLNLNPFYHFEGAIDEIALYNIALDESLIKRHFQRMESYCDQIYLISAPGVFRKGAWYLDANGTGRWEKSADIARPKGSFGLENDIPVIGDWDGDGTSKIGVFRKGAWYLDSNGSGTWNAGDTAISAGSFGLATDKPITGDWNGDGTTKIGVFRKGAWYLDADGNDTWNAGDTAISAGSFGLPNDIPVTGDWNGDGKTEIGVFRKGAWYLDSNGSGTWNSGDKAIAAGSFGLANDIPVTGDWNGDGITEIGVFRDGKWYFDFDGNGKWNSSVDIALPKGSFGLENDIPITGIW